MSLNNLSNVIKICIRSFEKVKIFIVFFDIDLKKKKISEEFR